MVASTISSAFDTTQAESGKTNEANDCCPAQLPPFHPCRYSAAQPAGGCRKAHNHLYSTAPGLQPLQQPVQRGGITIATFPVDEAERSKANQIHSFLRNPHCGRGGISLFLWPQAEN